MDINFKNDAFALVGIKSTNPEIVGTDSMDLNIEIPMGKPVKVSLKLTSTVASSVVAQKELNQIARDNISFLGSKIAEGIHYLMDNAYYWCQKKHEIETLLKQRREEDKAE